jgi:hypothetical protein
MENPKSIFETLKGELTPEDDVGLWETALTVLADEFLQRYDREAKNRTWVFLVGACSHWVRPHNSCWNAAGGFVYPEGYQSSLPELNWSVILAYSNQCWTPLRKLPGKNNVVFRVALPTRSARHKQAAVHTKWSTVQDPVLYGFRNIEGIWKCVASSDERTQGAIREMTQP